MSKLRHVYFHFVTKVLRIFKVAQFTQRAKRSENASSGRLQEVKKNRQSLSFQARGRGRLHFVFFDWRSFMGGVRLRKVVAHGGRTVCGELRQDL